MPVVLSVYGGLGLGLALNPTPNPYLKARGPWGWCNGRPYEIFLFCAVAKKMRITDPFNMGLNF